MARDSSSESRILANFIYKIKNLNLEIIIWKKILHLIIFDLEDYFHNNIHKILSNISFKIKLKLILTHH